MWLNKGNKNTCPMSLHHVTYPVPASPLPLATGVRSLKNHDPLFPDLPSPYHIHWFVRDVVQYIEKRTFPPLSSLLFPLTHDVFWLWITPHLCFALSLSSAWTCVADMTARCCCCLCTGSSHRGYSFVSPGSLSEAKNSVKLMTCLSLKPSLSISRPYWVVVTGRLKVVTRIRKNASLKQTEIKQLRMISLLETVLYL